MDEGLALPTAAMNTQPFTPAPGTTPDAEPDLSPQLQSASILIVDDEPLNVALLRTMLERAGYQDLREVSDSRVVMAHCKERLPDLVLLDLMMPFVDGFQVMEQLRRFDRR